MKNVQLFKKVFSALALSLMVGSAQTAHAAKWNLQRTAVSAMLFAPVIRLLTKVEPAANPLLIDNLSDFLSKASQAVKDKQLAAQFLDDALIGYWQGEKSYGVLARIFRTATAFEKAIKPFIKLMELDEKFGFTQDPRSAATVVTVAPEHKGNFTFIAKGAKMLAENNDLIKHVDA